MEIEGERKEGWEGDSEREKKAWMSDGEKVVFLRNAREE